MSRDVEVLTWALKALRDEMHPSAPKHDLDVALMHAISALEEKEAPRTPPLFYECPKCFEKRDPTRGCEFGCGRSASKSSSDSMEEENRRLKTEMEHVRNSVLGARIGLAENGPGWLREWFDGVERRLGDALHPHKSWCRGDHSEGAWTVGSEQTAESFAKYHDEQAGYGGAGREFHERAASFLRTQNAEIAALRQRVDGLETIIREREARIIGMRKAMNEADDRGDFRR